MAAVHLLTTLLERSGPVVLLAFLFLSWSALQKLIISEISSHGGCECYTVLYALNITETYAETPPMSPVAKLRASGASLRRVRR
jgi:hypothetical protein